jgi:hypothetical protein
MKRRTVPLAPWQRAEVQNRLETGAAITSLRTKGYAWTDLADAFGLDDATEARHLAVGFLLASAKDKKPTAKARPWTGGRLLPTRSGRSRCPSLLQQHPQQQSECDWSAH